MTNVLTAFSCQRTFVIFYLLNSDITRGVVHNYAFSCIHRHIGCRQRKCAWNLDGAHAVVVNAEPLLPYTVDLFCMVNTPFFGNENKGSSLTAVCPKPYQKKDRVTKVTTVKVP